MSHYWFNRQELLQKAKDWRHSSSSKEKAADYYIANKHVLKKKTKNKYKVLPGKENEAKREYSRNKYKSMKEK